MVKSICEFLQTPFSRLLRDVKVADGSRCVTIVILEKGIIPPNALFEKINPDIDVEFYHTEVRTRKTGRFICWLMCGEGPYRVRCVARVRAPSGVC